MSNLEQLDVSWNRLCDQNDFQVFRHLAGLKNVRMLDNKISKLPNAHAYLAAVIRQNVEELYVKNVYVNAV